MAEAVKSPDRTYIDQMAAGLPIVGTALPSGRWPPIDEQPEL